MKHNVPSTINGCRKALAMQNQIGRSYYLVPDKSTPIPNGIGETLMPGEFPDPSRPQQLLSMMALMQVADALNGGRSIFDASHNGGYCFAYDAKKRRVEIIECADLTSSPVRFKTFELAINAKKILGTGRIAEALGY